MPFRSWARLELSVEDNLMRAFLLCLFLWLIPMDMATCKVPRPSRHRAGAEDAIRKAVFQHWLHLDTKLWNHRPVKTGKASEASRDRNFPIKVLFFAVEGHNPSDNLIRSFANHQPPIKGISESYIDPKPHDKAERGFWVRDKKTHQIGLIYAVDRIHWLTHAKAEVDSSFFGGGLFGAGNKSTVTRMAKRWKVEHIEDQWVS